MVAKFLTKSHTTHFCLFGAECFYLKDKQILDNIILVIQQVKDITKGEMVRVAGPGFTLVRRHTLGASPNAIATQMK